MGLRNDVSVISRIQLLGLSKYFHRLVSRFFLNLRYIAFRQQQTALGTTVEQSTFSASRKHTTWKQSGRPRTDFIVDLSMDKTTDHNEAYPNEGDIHQAETLNLEVIESQNQRNEGKHDSGTMNKVDQW